MSEDHVIFITYEGSKEDQRLQLDYDYPFESCDIEEVYFYYNEYCNSDFTYLDYIKKIFGVKCDVYFPELYIPIRFVSHGFVAYLAPIIPVEIDEEMDTEEGFKRWSGCKNKRIIERAPLHRLHEYIRQKVLYQGWYDVTIKRCEQ
jgi:hypothetical protein